VGVRERFLAGSGAAASSPSNVCHRLAWPVTLAIARAIAPRASAPGLSFAKKPNSIISWTRRLAKSFAVFTTTYELLVERGFNARAVLMNSMPRGIGQDHYEMAEAAMFRQMNYHSQTCQ
jgi:hypothetical protein